ncbi:MAG TPA: hypothetical protein VGF91_29880 [Solirubrobacteraceae bacterium]
MESNITPNPQYTQVTVDVPEDRLAEFHAFFARFLAGPGGRRRGGRHGRHGRHGHGHHGRGCRRGNERAEESQPATEATEI